MNRFSFERSVANRALTLIETAAVITLASGAMALLLPTMKQGREAARLQTCLSNLGQVNRSLLGYINERRSIPFYELESGTWATWSYGGWSGRYREFWESANPAYNIQTREKPLSAYMSAWEIPQEIDRTTPTQEVPLFQCPSDSNSVQWQWGSFDPNEPCQNARSAYDDVGTSYQFNIQWFSQGQLATTVFKKYLNNDASRFIMLYEDRVDYGFSVRLELMGMHGEYSKHVASFADGSALYLYLDSRHGHDSLPFPPGPKHGKYENLGAWSVVDWEHDHFSGNRHE